MQRVMDHLETLRRFGQKLGPYLMLEILLPGGSFFALMLFLYQRRKLGNRREASRRVQAVMRPLASLVPQGIFVVQPCYLRPTRASRSAINDLE